MWELARGHDSGLTRARRAVERRIALLESDYSDDELRLLDGWSAPPGRHVEVKGKGYGAVRRTSCRTARLRYEPLRPVGIGWSFRLRVERLAPDGEWEPC